LEVEGDLVADAGGAAQQLAEDDHLTGEREGAALRADDVREELRQHDVQPGRRRRAAERPGHLDQRAVDGPRTLAHGYHDRGDDGYHQRHDERLVREPYRQVGDDEEQDARDREQHDEPALQQVVDALGGAHSRPRGDADEHADGEGGEHPLGGDPQVPEQDASLVLADHELQRLERARDQVRRRPRRQDPDEQQRQVGGQRQPGADAGASGPPRGLTPDDGRGHGPSIHRHPADQLSAGQELGGIGGRVDALDAYRLRAGELDEALDHGHEAVDRLLVPLARGAGLPPFHDLRELAGVGQRVETLVEDRLPE